jgi:SRSO17 transposase
MQEVAVRQWGRELVALHGRIAPRFCRAEPRARALRYLRGLLSSVQRKNGWQLAEHLGERSPDGVQRLLNAAHWDADAVRDDLRAYVVERLGDREAVLVVDETGFLKKGSNSVGVKRQYSSPAGRIENCQVGVFLCYASRHAAAFIDRALYLPKEWAADAERRAQAGVPEAVAFQTKPALALAMIERALDAGVPCRWVTGDEVYGGDRTLRFVLEQRRQPFVLAIACNEPLWRDGPVYRPAQEIADQLPATAWQRLSAGAGTKGPRFYDWAWQPLWRLQLTTAERAWGHWLVVRRSLKKPDERAYYVAFAPREGMTLKTLAQVAGRRWAIEAGFEATKQECGLDEYEVRSWQAWHRHVTLALLAHAFLVAMQLQAKKGGLRLA